MQELASVYLDQVGLAIYKAEGKLVATGRITHKGPLGEGRLNTNSPPPDAATQCDLPRNGVYI